MTTNPTITVTEEDIKNGLRGDDRSCPVALALKRAYPEYAESIKVGGIFTLTGWERYKHEKVIRFDVLDHLSDNLDVRYNVAAWVRELNSLPPKL